MKEEEKKTAEGALTDRSRYFLVGEIAGTHALKGEVRVFPVTEDPSRFTTGLQLYLETKRGETIPLIVASARRHGKFVLVKFRDYDTVEAVGHFQRCRLYVDRKDAIPLEEGEYYVADLIGLLVYDEEERLLGTLAEVIETGANDVYRVALDPSFAESLSKESTEQKRAKTPKEVLLPAIKDCILQVDVDAGRMRVRLMPGLL